MAVKYFDTNITGKWINYVYSLSIQSQHPWFFL